MTVNGLFLNRKWLFLSFIFLVSLIYSSWQLGKFLAIWNHNQDTEAKLMAAAKLLGHWFQQNQTAQGDFTYEISVGSGQATVNYNIVRQAGSLYSLTQLYRETRDPELKSTIEKGLTFFQTLATPRQDATAAAIVYQSETESNTSALVLLALVEFLETNPQDKEAYLPLARNLNNFLLSTQKANGGFAQQPDLNQLELDYNNGETFYALTRMYLLDPHPETLKASQKAAEYFIEHYSTTSPNLSFYSWGMSGFAYLYTLDPQEKYWQFMRESTNAVLSNPGQKMLKLSQGSAIYKAGWGVFLEGIAHVAWIAKAKDPVYFRQLKSFYLKALQNLLTLQIDGPFSTLTAAHPQVSGGMCYDTLCLSQRIDITHHNLSAIYLYFKFLDEDEAGLLQFTKRLFPRW